MEEFNLDYDKDSDDLFLFAKEKSKGSVEIGDLILDFDKDSRLVGIEILNATKFLSDCIGDKDKISKDFLSNLLKCEVKIKQRNNFLFVMILLIGKDLKIPCPINAPIVTDTSPALAYA